jgi:hypothetical protein
MFLENVYEIFVFLAVLKVFRPRESLLLQPETVGQTKSQSRRISNKFFKEIYSKL